MIRRILMSGFGLGHAPVASGTFGSAGAVIFAFAAWALWKVSGVSAIWLDLAWIILALLASIGCVKWGKWAIHTWQSGAKKKSDPGIVVLDEFAGQWVALIALPMLTLQNACWVLAVQFFLFRVFDVIKPPPGRQLEKLPDGWGILLDDIAAGVYANLIGQIVFRYFW